MTTNYSGNSVPPKTPQPSKNKTRQNLIGICTAIAITGVVCSGAAAYGGYKIAESQQERSNISQNTTENNSSNSSLDNPVISDDGSILVADVSEVVDAIRPSVVEINTEIMSNGNSIFGQYISEGAGSGVIISEDGYIVTNDHVISGASQITVKTMDGQEYEAKLVGTDPQTDIAIIKVDGSSLPAATIGSSDDIRVGEIAIAIGNPLGSLGGTVTTGIISAVGREITINNETMTLLQTDAAINSGNSGGGLFDAQGQLIGIVNAKQAATGVEGLGFAIPISDVLGVIDDLKAYGVVTSRPFLNVSLQDVNGNGQMPAGVCVVQVVDGGSAANAGVEFGDRIVSFDGKEVSSAAEVKKILRSLKVGDTVPMVVDRDGHEVELQIDLQGNTSIN